MNNGAPEQRRKNGEEPLQRATSAGAAGAC